MTYTQLIEDGKLKLADPLGNIVLQMDESLRDLHGQIALTGEITVEADHAFRDELLSAAIVCRELVLDFSGVTMLSSTALTSLLAVQHAIETKPGGSLLLKGMSSPVFAVFRENGYDALFEIETGGAG